MQQIKLLKYLAVLLLVFPLFTQADIPQPYSASQDALNPAPNTFAWTPAIARDYARQQAVAVGMNQRQVSAFVATLSCESAGFKDPAIQSNYYHKGRREPSFGYAQIDLDYNDVTKAQATDPTFAIPFAAKIFKTNPRNWSCYSLI